MSYYKDKQRANIYLSGIINAIEESRREVNVSAVILEVTKKHAVSESGVLKRIEWIAENTKGMLLIDGVIKWAPK